MSFNKNSNILETAQNILLLMNDFNNTGILKSPVNKNGNIKIKSYKGKTGAYFDNSIENFLTLNFSKPSLFTFSFWICSIDNSYYTSVSISSTSNWNPVFQCDMGNNTFFFYVAMPNHWDIINNGNAGYINNWVHLTYTVDQTNFTVKQYINGYLTSISIGNGPLPTRADNYIIGRSGDNERAFYGYINCFCTFDSILNDSQIKDLYEQTMNLQSVSILNNTINVNNTYNQGIFQNAQNLLLLTKDYTNYGKLNNSNINGNVPIAKNYGRLSAYFNNSINNFLTCEFNNPFQFTFSYWIYTLDNNYYTAVSISNTQNLYPVFQCDFGNGYYTNNEPTIVSYAALPNTWDGQNRTVYNYVNNWVHIAYTIDQSNFTIKQYINGYLTSSSTGNGPLPTRADNYIIGKSGDNGRAFYGYINCFCTFDSILNDSQIKDLYNSSKDLGQNVLYKNCDYKMESNEYDCYKTRYPSDLSKLTDSQLQTHWSSIGCKENRNNQCPAPQKSSGLYNFKGCFNENADDPALPFSWGKEFTNIDDCAKIATDNKHTLFSLNNNINNNAECRTGNDEKKAMKYGENYDRNSCNLLGELNTNQLYSRSIPYSPPLPPIPKLTNPDFNMTNESFKNMNNYNKKNILFIIILIFLIIILGYYFNFFN